MKAIKDIADGHLWRILSHNRPLIHFMAKEPGTGFTLTNTLKILLSLLIFSNNISAQESWTRKADFPGVRYRASSFSIGNKGYVAAGITPTGQTNDLWEYDPTNDTWSRKADLPSPGRAGAAGFSIDGKGYIGSGSQTGSGSYGVFWEYDPETDQWTQKATIPINFASSGTITSFSTSDRGYVKSTYSDESFWEYNPNTDSWTQKGEFPGTGRRSQVGFSIGSKGYLGTGFDGNNNTSEFWEYNPGNDTWSRKADFPGSPRNGAVGFGMGGKGYIGLGNSRGRFPRDFWSYDPVSDSWSQIDSCGYAAEDAFSFVIDSKAYVGTGLFSAVGELWEYDPALNTISLEDFALYQNYPNPFNHSTTIDYHLTGQSQVTLSIYNIRGAEIRVFNISTPGTGSIVWSGRDKTNNEVSTGIYFCKLQVSNLVKIKKMLYLK